MPIITAASRVGQRVRDCLKSSGLTQVDLATSLGLSQASISARLRGVVAFDVEELDRVADLLGVAPADLLGDDKPESGAVEVKS